MATAFIGAAAFDLVEVLFTELLQEVIDLACFLFRETAELAAGEFDTVAQLCNLAADELPNIREHVSTAVEIGRGVKRAWDKAGGKEEEEPEAKLQRTH